MADIIDKRRKEGWRITFWCTKGSVICQITTPDEFDDGSPGVDVACVDFSSAVRFARAVCRRPSSDIEQASDLVFNWQKTSPETFLALLAT